MKTAKVLICDDAVVVRRILRKVLDQDPAIDVVGVAANGKIALQKIPKLEPTVVVLDIEMPELDGLQTLKAIRTTYPDLPVIMFSTLTRHGGEATLDALSLGASDYVTKPANVGSVNEAIDAIRSDLAPKIRLFGGATAVPSKTLVERAIKVRQSTPSTRVKRVTRSAPVDLVAIGVSTGGPQALVAVLSALPNDLSVPVVIVQHMPALFTELLAKRLDSLSELNVAEAYEGAPLRAGDVWIAPGGKHLEIRGSRSQPTLHTHNGPRENSCRPAVDVMFRSAATVYGGGVLAVVLTGMGSDGLRGAEQICEVGGTVYAQDKASSVVWGMPGAVVAAGLHSKEVELSQVASSIVRAVRGKPGKAA